MKPNKICAIAILSAAAFAASCGSSDDNNNDFLFVSGTWQGALTLSEDTCHLAGLPANIAFTHNVNQNETAVTLDDGSVHYLGNTLGSGGFSVNATGVSELVAPGNTCTFTNAIEYHEIRNDDDNSADVVVTGEGPCTSNPSCTVRYTGSATRNP